MKRRAICCLLLAGVLQLAGCGGEAVHTSAETGSGAAVSEVPSEEEEAVSQDDNAAQDEEAANPAENAAQGEETDKDSQAADGNAAAAEGNFMAPVEMDETLKNQLTEEMLEESEMDASVVESAPVTKGCSFTLPEAFAESEDIEGMYVTKRYPIDASTIYYVALGRDVALQLMTEETFKAQAEENFRKAYGEDIEVTIDSFERIKIDGCPAFRILCHYQVDGTEMSQLEYAINADKSYVITYSQTSDYDRMEEYEASAETIRLEF